MKKVLIGTLVGAILVFGWQAVANMALHYHDANYTAPANDGAVITALSTNIKKEGQYYVPAIDMKASAEERQKFADGMKGKPWAIIEYHPSFDEDMGSSILRSFVTALLCVAIFIGLMGRSHGPFLSVLLKGLGIGFFSFMFIWYNQNIWMQTPWSVLWGEMIDALVAWTLCGAWLGWWLNRPSNAPRKTYG